MSDESMVRPLEAGEVVNVVITGAVVAHRFAADDPRWPGHVLLDLGPITDRANGEQGRLTIELPPGLAAVRYLRQTPAEGEPRSGEIWTDALGEQYLVTTLRDSLGVLSVIGLDGARFSWRHVHAGETGPLRRIWAPPPPEPVVEVEDRGLLMADEVVEFPVCPDCGHGKHDGYACDPGCFCRRPTRAGSVEPEETAEQAAVIVDANLRAMGSAGLDADDRLDQAITAVRELQADADFSHGDTLIEPCERTDPHSPHGWTRVDPIAVEERDMAQVQVGGETADDLYPANQTAVTLACPGVPRPAAPTWADESPF